ncbi:hypothetical protein HK100_009715 [Physocladia obscura]|uniref:Pseudouridine synthase I TruA alpha/beta domain-containing protein n=1 Tax=Physocladia obscura TaxID=109957 RepID=A0AAD5X787_9FUNG|nr:hypothetical protein HK100_009715 [Physocladia obscura]
MEYSGWTKEQLIARLQRLESSAAANNRPPDADAIENAAESAKQTKKSSRFALEPTKGKKDKSPRAFDFSAHSARHVAFKVAYLGWDYHGLAAQDGSGSNASVPTIEQALFSALHTARLIPAASGVCCAWSRCGRTDKGVSSFGQVVSFVIRSNLPKGAAGTCEWPSESSASSATKRKYDDDDNTTNDAKNSPVVSAKNDAIDIDFTPIPADFQEIPYVSRLNHILPSEIRVLAWSPTCDTFNARFDCSYRRYRYFLPVEGLDVFRMQEAAKLFIGDKDYRHFCKVDPSKNVKSYVRTVIDASVRHLVLRSALDRSGVPTSSNSSVVEDETLEPLSPDQFIVFEVKGYAFLWHQVRCMTAILQLIGRGLEPVSLISDLTDLSKHPPDTGRPIYNMASEIPLVLVECGYPEGLLDWRIDSESAVAKADNKSWFPSSEGFAQLISGLWLQWRTHAIKATQIQSLLQTISVNCFPSGNVTFRDLYERYSQDIVLGSVCGEAGGYGGKSTKKYLPIMQRKRCDSIETRTVKHNASKKLKQKE